MGLGAADAPPAIRLAAAPSEMNTAARQSAAIAAASASDTRFPVEYFSENRAAMLEPTLNTLIGFVAEMGSSTGWANPTKTYPTTTLKLAEPVPLLSVAEHVTLVVPIGN